MVSTVFALFFSAAAFAQDGPFPSGDPYFSFEHQHTEAPNSTPSLNVEEQKASFSVPLRKTETTTLSFIGGGNRTELSDALRFLDRGVDIPKEFQSTQAGLAWQKRGRHRYGVAATFGRAGRGFWSGDGSGIVTVSANLERPLESGNSWMFFLHYSNNRTTLNNIPLPGFAYVMNGASYRLMLGLPFLFLHYRTGGLALMAFGSPFSASTDLSYRIWGPAQIYGSASWNPRAYQNLVAGSEDRLIFITKEAGAGLRVSLTREIQFSGGYVRAFDRRLLLGRSRSEKNSSTVRLDDADGYQARLRFSF